MAHLPVVSQARAGDHVVSEIGRDHTVCGHQGEKIGNVLCVEARSIGGHRGCCILHSDKSHVSGAFACRHLNIAPGDHTLNVAARFGGEVDHDRPGPHSCDHVARHEKGRWSARNGGGCDQHICCGDVGCEQLALMHRAILTLLAGVAAWSLDGVEVESDEGSAHRRNLVGGGGAHVVGGHPRTQALRGADRLQPSNTGAEHKHAGRRNRAGRGHVKREEPRESHGRLKHRAITGDERLGTEGIHRLCPRDTRHQFEGEGCHASVGEGGHGGQFGRWRCQADADRSRMEPGGLRGRERANMAVNIKVSGGQLRHDGCASIRIGGVGVPRFDTGPRLDQDFDSQTPELAHRFRCCRDAAFAL